MKPQRWTRRQHDRHEVFECALLVRPKQEEVTRTIIVDIGLGGIQIRSKKRLPVGEICQVKVGRDNGVPLTIRGEVRYSNYMAESGLYASGLRYAPASHEERLVIAAFLNSVVQERKE